MNSTSLLSRCLLLVSTALIVGGSPLPGHAQGLAQQIGALARSLQQPDAVRRHDGARLAVVQFSSDPALEGFGRFLRASLQDRFDSAGHFKLVTPEQLNAALKRLHLAPGAALSADDIQRLGIEAAAEIVVIGEIADQPGSIAVNAQVVTPATGETLATVQVLFSKALIPPEFLQASEVDQFKPPSMHPLREGEAFQIAALCKTLLPVELKALQAAIDGKLGKAELSADAQYLRITYGPQSPEVSWVSIRGGIVSASTASPKTLASFRAMDVHISDILEAMSKSTKELTRERRVQLLCFNTVYFVEQPETYLRAVIGLRDLGHFITRGAIYIPPDMKVHEMRITSLHRGWDGGFGFSYDTVQLDPRTAKAGDYISLNNAASTGTHRFEASTYLSRELSGPQPGIGLLEVVCDPGEKPLRVSLSKGPDFYWVPIGQLDAIFAVPSSEDKPAEEKAAQ